MPLFDDILSQPAILISFGVAFLLIVAAIVLAVRPRLKASRVRAKKRRAAALAARENMIEEAATDIEEDAPVVKKPAAAQAAKAAAAATPSAPVVSAKPGLPAPPSAPVVSASGAPAAASALNAALSGGTTTETKKEEVTPEMQDLLSSVFSDEENSERQEILLKGIEPVAIDELLTLTKAVAAQLRGEQPSNLVRVKENKLS